MKKTNFNPKTLYWIFAFFVLLGGIFSLNYDFHFQLGSMHTSLSFAHIGAITSGILSMVSFGYGALKKDLPPNAMSVFHILASIALLCLAFYYEAALNLLDGEMPTLESTTDTVQKWESENETWMDYLNIGQIAYFAFVGLQLLFFVYIFFKNKSQSVPQVDAS